MSPDEATMLADLARAANAPAADVMRDLIRRAHEDRFPKLRPGAQRPPTVRALLEDLAGPVHLTTANIAERMRLPVGAVRDALLRLSTKRIVEKFDTHGRHESWEIVAPLEKALAVAAAGGTDVDAPFFKDVLSFEVYVDGEDVLVGPIDPHTRNHCGDDGSRRAMVKALAAAVAALPNRNVKLGDVAIAVKHALERVALPGAVVDVYSQPTHVVARISRLLVER